MKLDKLDEEELMRRTNPIIMVLERRREEKEWSSAEVMRILRKRAAKRIAATSITDSRDGSQK